MYSHILTEGLYSVPKKSKDSTISAQTLFHSKSFVHQSSQHREGPQPQQSNFRCHALPAIELPCATVNGNRGMWFGLPLKMQLDLSENSIDLHFCCQLDKAYFLCEIPLGMIRIFLSYLYRSQLQIFQEKDFGGESMYHPIYLLHAERANLPANPSLVELWGNLSPTESLWAKPAPPSLPLSSTTSCCNILTVNFSG